MNGLYTIILLVLSNVFMTLAWYGHLKLQETGVSSHWPLIGVIVFSWGVKSCSVFSCCFTVRLVEFNLAATVHKVFHDKPEEFDPRKYLGPVRKTLKALYMRRTAKSSALRGIRLTANHRITSSTTKNSPEFLTKDNFGHLLGIF